MSPRGVFHFLNISVLTRNSPKGLRGMESILLNHRVLEAGPRSNRKQSSVSHGALSRACAFSWGEEDTLYLHSPTTHGSPALSHSLLKEASCSEDKQEEDIQSV